MHSLTTRVFLGILLLVATASAADDDPVDWFNNYQRGLEEARKTGKPIFLEHRCEP